MSEWLIKHQVQPCAVSCVSTCIAMITDQPASEVVERFHARYRETDLSIGDMLRELVIPFSDFRSSNRNSIVNPGIYLMGVPSLNIRGGGHQIVLELDDDMMWTVFDPFMGREGKSYYVTPFDVVPATHWRSHWVAGTTSMLSSVIPI